jgi:hypothetical protein
MYAVAMKDNATAGSHAKVLSNEIAMETQANAMAHVRITKVIVRRLTQMVTKLEREYATATIEGLIEKEKNLGIEEALNDAIAEVVKAEEAEIAKADKSINAHHPTNFFYFDEIQ